MTICQKSSTTPTPDGAGVSTVCCGDALRGLSRARLGGGLPLPGYLVDTVVSPIGLLVGTDGRTGDDSGPTPEVPEEESENDDVQPQDPEGGDTEPDGVEQLDVFLDLGDLLGGDVLFVALLILVFALTLTLTLGATSAGLLLVGSARGSLLGLRLTEIGNGLGKRIILCRRIFCHRDGGNEQQREGQDGQ